MSLQNQELDIRRLDSPAAVAPYLDGWRELAAGAPMRSPEWLLGWWKSFAAADDRLWILLLREPDGTLVGLAPLYLHEATGRGILRILGAAENCTHHQDWLAAEGWQERVGRAVARYLFGCRPEWKRLWFEAVDADATAIHATVACLTQKGCLEHRRPINSVWKIALPTTWDEYLMMLSRSLRKRCRKLQREFLDSGQIQIRLAETEEGRKEGFEILVNLHATRWGRAGTAQGVFSDERFLRFHEQVTRDLLRRKQLRLAWLESDGRPLAIEYQFFDGDSVYAYLAGIDLEGDEFSSGKLTMMAAIRFAIEKGCRYFDLLGGDEPYKANWRAMPMACHDLRVWQKTALGAVEYGLWHGYSHAVARLKPHIPRRVTETGLKLLRSARSLFGRKD